ncbi:uncharacterized protein DEA37_0001741 [Paragonimus westermani]|uniref:Uncharacterized protein n=1 Tax=Paragonimus westermani TaxID=34504 RepID=A0A5J4NHJ3_9TREM|nr:uncharacterized protein DEA37_0001741 [Paragonimus westermani]
MPLFNTVLFTPHIDLPTKDAEFSEVVACYDDRSKVAEVEAAFEEFESDLAVQLYRHISPIGKRTIPFPSGLDDFGSNTSNNLHQSAVTRTNLPSPLSNLNDSLNLDAGMHDFEMANTTPLSMRTSGSRLPRRIVGLRTPTNALAVNLTLSFPDVHQSGHSVVSSQTAVIPGETALNPVELTGGSPVEPHLIPEVGETEGSDNFLADEEAEGIAVPNS